MSTEVKVEKLSASTLVLAAILSVGLTIFWDVFTIFLPSIAFCTQNVSNLIPASSIELMGGPFIMFVFLLLLMRIPSLRKHLTTTNLVYIYIIALGVSYFANTSYPWGYIMGGALAKVAEVQAVSKYIPDFVAYPKDIAALLIAGYGSIGAMPWSVLFPGIFYHFLLVALFGGISIGIANIFRRQWIDVEGLPFPQVMLAHSALVNVENSGKREWLQRKPFLYGILAGFVLAIPISATTLFPWFPDIFGWRTATCGPGTWQIASDTPWNLGIAKHIPIYALLLLAPLHSLFSVVFYTAILEILLFFSYYGLGAYTGIAGEGFCGKIWCYPNDPYDGPPLYFHTVLAGAALGLFVITIVLERRHIIETLRAAFGSRSEQEKLEPISYRASWTILIVSYILFMVFFIFTGFSPWVAFVMPLTGIMTWFVQVQLWGRVGFGTEGDFFASGFFRMFYLPTVALPEVNSTDVALSGHIIEEWCGHQSITGWGGSMYATLASYRMAKLTNVNPRNALKVLFIGLFVSMFVTNIVQIAVVGVYGAARFPSPLIKEVGVDLLDEHYHVLWSRPASGPLSNMTPHLIIGFVFMVVTRYLCSRFLWMPDPIMAMVAWSWDASLMGVGLACLVAWVIKSIVLRVGGSKLYEQWVVPFVGGFMLGDALEVLLAALTAYGLVRFA